MKRSSPYSVRSQRRGTLLPALLMAIVTVCLAISLVLDRLWLDTARGQLRAAAEASAFAAAGQLATDFRLRSPPHDEQVLNDARNSAARIAAQNFVAGSPLMLDSAPGADIRFGVLVSDPFSANDVFLETDHDPTTVVVNAEVSRRRGNPVALMFQELTGIPSGNVHARAGVTLDNRVTGLRPQERLPIPAVPFAILAHDPSGERDDVWDVQIGQQQGGDEFGFDEATRQIIAAPDGLREITLTLSFGEDDFDADGGAEMSVLPNCVLTAIGNGLRPEEIARQIASGLTTTDLAAFGGSLSANQTTLMFADAAAAPYVVSELSRLVGQPKIWLLYREDLQAAEGSTGVGPQTISVVGFVAGRIMSIDTTSGDVVRLVLQPAVIRTPTAILGRDMQRISPNPYIYKLHLTY